MSKRYFPRDPIMEFYIGTPVNESFRRERPERDSSSGLLCLEGQGPRLRPEREILTRFSGVAVASVLERTTSDGEISGVAGRAVLGRPNPDENLEWERSVNRLCVGKCGSVEGETPFSRNETRLVRDAVEFFAGTPAGDEVRTDRSEEFFIGAPTPGDPETPPRAALEDHWVMRCIGKPADDTMGESDLRGLADHLAKTFAY